MTAFIGRREFITLLGGTAAAWPLAARAQQLNGFLQRVRNENVVAFIQALRDAGYIDGQNAAIETRIFETTLDRDPDFVKELIIAALEKRLMGWHKSNPVSQRLATVPGIGPIIATAIAAMVAEPSGFRSGREFAAWLGLVPRQNSTGGKNRLGGISKRGNQYLRRLLINGASANLLRSKATNADPWVIGLRRRRPSLAVAVALANKTARIAWAVMHRQENYQRMATAA